ncbi:ester cyclase [Parvibaculum sp.]|uniref:ester cyclase n=1 Tax=Parvibaculum sp. TaxID=2024848 RepID=UPI00320EBFEE
MSEAHKDIIRRYAAAFSAGDFETLRPLFTEDAVIQGVLGWGNIDEVAMPVWRDLHAAYGLQLIIEDMVAEGDKVAVRYTERGTFRAPFRGTEPTGKSYELVAMEWFEMRGSKIARRWGARDSASMQRQLAV